jgi:putative spermidine/putrescine transport system permease protein
VAAVHDPAARGFAGESAESLLQASADLGARPAQTFRTTLPLALPDCAGSVFTFSLTLGDYIIPSVVGAPGIIGMMVYQQQGTAAIFRWPLRSQSCRSC